MRQSKYSFPSYWKGKTSKNVDIWSGSYDNIPLNKGSVILQISIINSYSNLYEDSWVVYPNIQSVLGFLQFFYLPTAFLGILDDEADDSYYFEEDLGEVLDYFKEKLPEDEERITQMEDVYYELIQFWEKDEHAISHDIKEWGEKFNEQWNKEKGISFFINIFRSPKEVAEYIIHSYEEDLGLESLQADIGLSKESFLQLTDDYIYNNQFAQRQFMRIVTQKLNVTI
ncbi:hypothetical protein ACERII_20565 [Evansella sp. AB-rgal1]|uniref:hypothetical protein n=1 Tax=Evansella sp. AB-rgal1 TaxID=3242696 RepID=UPI00359DDC9F